MNFKEKCFMVLEEKGQIYTTSKGELKKILKALRGEGISVRVENHKTHYFIKENDLEGQHQRDIEKIKSKVYEIFNSVMADLTEGEDLENTDALEVMAQELIYDLGVDIKALNVEKIPREGKVDITGKHKETVIRVSDLIENFEDETLNYIMKHIFNAIADTSESLPRRDDKLTRAVIKWFE